MNYDCVALYSPGSLTTTARRFLKFELQLLNTQEDTSDSGALKHSTLIFKVQLLDITI
jgi:hypothetical protein